MHFFLCFCCIRFHRINSPFAGSILTTESVAVYTSTSPSQHNYSIQKFVPKIRCTCVGVYACAPMQFSLSLTVSLCLMLTLLSSFVRVTLQFQFDRITRFSCFLYLCLFYLFSLLCFVLLVFYWHFRGCVPALTSSGVACHGMCLCVCICVRDCNLLWPLVLFRTLE